MASLKAPNGSHDATTDEAPGAPQTCDLLAVPTARQYSMFTSNCPETGTCDETFDRSGEY